MDKRYTAEMRRTHLGQYTINETAELIGVPYRVFRYHMDRKMVAQPKRGEGKRKFYSVADIDKLKKFYNSTT